jgi:hypothetical protein
MEMSFWAYGLLIFLFGLSIFGGSLFVEWLVIKHVMDNPANGLLASIFGAFLIPAIGIIGTGHFDSFIVICLLGGLLFALALAFPGYLKRRKNFADQQLDELHS